MSVNDVPTIPVYVDTLQKLYEYVQYNEPTGTADMPAFQQAVDNRLALFRAHYTSRAVIEELKDIPDVY